MKLYLLRHTEPENAKGKCIGQFDADLPEDCEKKFQTIMEVYRDAVESSVFYASPLKRSQKLAEFIFKNAAKCTNDTVERRRRLKIDSRIQEMNFGAWEGMLWKDIPENEVRRWADNFLNTSPPGGETFSEMKERVMDFYEEVLKSGHENVLLVTHAGVIRMLLGSVLEIPAEKIFSLVIDFGKMSCISSSDGIAAVEFLNR